MVEDHIINLAELLILQAVHFRSPDIIRFSTVKPVFIQRSVVCHQKSSLDIELPRTEPWMQFGSSRKKIPELFVPFRELTDAIPRESPRRVRL
jgi:hypothetical protein